MQTFAIAPAGPRPLWFLVPIALILLGVAFLLVRSVLGSQRARFELSPSGLTLVGDFYGRFILWHRLFHAAANWRSAARSPAKVLSNHIA